MASAMTQRFERGLSSRYAVLPPAQLRRKGQVHKNERGSMDPSKQEHGLGLV